MNSYCLGMEWMGVDFESLTFSKASCSWALKYPQHCPSRDGPSQEGQGRSWIHCSKSVQRVCWAPWQTRLRHELRCNSCWMIQTQPSRNDRCHLKSCYIKQRVFNCSNHLMLHTHFKRVVLGRLATCCVREVLIHLCSFTALLCTTNHWQSSKLESNVTEEHFLTFPAPLSPLTMMDWFTGSICFWTFL